jgi:ABC-type sugar transport system substrate-binding protein
MKELGGEFTVGRMANGTPEDQFNLIEGWLSQGYDAIEVFPLDVTSLAPLQQRAQSEGIKWITYLTPMDGDDGTVGPNPTAQGTLLAEGFMNWVNTTNLGTKALVLDFSPLSASGPRVQLAAQACEEQTDIEIVSVQDSVDPATAQQITENTLRAHPDLDVVLCLTDDAAGGAVNAFTNAGKDPTKCFIGGCDGTQEALEALLGGTAYKASAAIDVRQQGHEMAEYAHALIQDGTPVGAPTPATLLTPEDADKARELLSRYTDN